MALAPSPAALTTPGVSSRLRLDGGGDIYPLPRSAALAVALRARWEAALYVFVSAPYPAAVANAAYFTVEEGAVVVSYLVRRRRRAAAEAVLEDGRSDPYQIARAHHDLLDAEDAPGSSLLHDSVELLVRSGSSVVLESVFAATGTMLWPGWGTSVFSVVGSVVCWLI